MYTFNEESMKKYWKVLFMRMHSNELCHIIKMLDNNVPKDNIIREIDIRLINLKKRLDLTDKDIYTYSYSNEKKH